MNLIITKAKKQHLKECEKALINSNLGRNYFSSKDSAKNALGEGLKKQELSVVLGEERAFIGFFWIIMNGAFHNFPYLHIIVVKEEIRGQGFGKRILKEMALSETIVDFEHMFLYNKFRTYVWRMLQWNTYHFIRLSKPCQI